MNQKGKVVAVVQARMGSSRLPGKVMKTICHKPVIELMLERLSKSKLIDEIVVATTNLNDDNIISEWAENLNYSVFRGSELDCLDRHYQVGKKFRAAIFTAGKLVCIGTFESALVAAKEYDLAAIQAKRPTSDLNLSMEVESSSI